MTTFDKSFEDRNSSINLAEEKMLEFFANYKVVRFGIDAMNRDFTGSEFTKIPKILRAAPDYIVIMQQAYFVEVKGFRDCLKIKHQDLVTYKKWDKILPVRFYIYDCDKMESHPMSLLKILDLAKRSKTKRYQNNNQEYYEIRL